MSEQLTLAGQLTELVQIARERGYGASADFVSRMLDSRVVVYKPGEHSSVLLSLGAPGDRGHGGHAGAEIEDLEDELRESGCSAPVVAAELAQLLACETELGSDSHWHTQVCGLLEAALLYGWYQQADEPMADLHALVSPARSNQPEPTLDRALEPLLGCPDPRVSEPAQSYVDARLADRERIARILRQLITRELERRGITLRDA